MPLSLPDLSPALNVSQSCPAIVFPALHWATSVLVCTALQQQHLHRLKAQSSGCLGCINLYLINSPPLPSLALTLHRIHPIPA